jgi:hypothetical protein
MKLHPFEESVKLALKVIREGATVYQQFNCSGCGQKQTVDVPNKMYEEGICEECGHVTNIKHDGCNFAVIFGITFT